MPPKIVPKKLQLPNISSPNGLRLKNFLDMVQLKNKGNYEGWLAVKWDDIAASYLQVHEKFNGKSSPGYKTALKEVCSPDLRAEFERYQKKFNQSNKKQPNSQERRKTEAGLTVPHPSGYDKKGNWSYAAWIGLVKAENPGVELTREMADEILGKFEMAVIDMRGGSRISKEKKERLSHMWTERKDYWRNEEKISQRKRDHGS